MYTERKEVINGEEWYLLIDTRTDKVISVSHESRFNFEKKSVLKHHSKYIVYE